MSVLARHTDKHPASHAASSAHPGAILIRWQVGLGPGLDTSTLEIRVERCPHAGGVLTADLLERRGDDATPRRLLDNEPSPLHWLEDREHGLLHIDAPDGLLRCTLARDDDGALRVLYARTSLLARCGVRGGGYEPLDAAPLANPLTP
ncbi:MAG: hypothetical protein EA379_07775 [Phycisphaerales bacterium]|nr:MAG: hypothetical protein EA379_07775 [Phycisphaerales bacterium]